MHSYIKTRFPSGVIRRLTELLYTQIAITKYQLYVHYCNLLSTYCTGCAMCGQSVAFG